MVSLLTAIPIGRGVPKQKARFDRVEVNERVIDLTDSSDNQMAPVTFLQEDTRLLLLQGRRRKLALHRLLEYAVFLTLIIAL